MTKQIFVIHKTSKNIVAKKRKTPNNNSTKIGRWSKEEHENFIIGCLKYGGNWRKVYFIIKI